MSCKCQKCKKQFKIDFLVDDDLWIKISPKGNFSGLLCGKCIIDKLESFGYGAFKLIDLVSSEDKT